MRSTANSTTCRTASERERADEVKIVLGVFLLDLLLNPPILRLRGSGTGWVGAVLRTQLLAEGFAALVVVVTVLYALWCDDK